MKVLAKYWFTPLPLTASPHWVDVIPTTIGIIVIESRPGHLKAYIGMGFGQEEDRDAQQIASGGARFPSETAKVLFKDYGLEGVWE